MEKMITKQIHFSNNIIDVTGAILLNRPFSSFGHKNRPQWEKWPKYFI